MPRKSIVKRFGRIPDPRYTADFVGRLPYRHLPDRIMRQATKRDVFLWKAKDSVQANWKRGAQGIGDCVSWGAELACTCLLWNLCAQGLAEWEAEAATESTYGLCRVEVHGKPVMGLHEDGAAGSWAADAVNKFGVLLRLDYSQQTGNPAHDLRKYDPRRAQNWGYYGNGGESDKNALDDESRKYPVQDVTQIRTVEEAAAALDAGCVITIASTVGFEGDRNSEGIIAPRGQWPHQMCILGIKYTPNGEPLFRVFNSWNGSVKGPDPEINDPAVSECSWWITAQALQMILRDDDSFAFSNVKGFRQKPYDFQTGLIV